MMNFSFPGPCIGVPGPGIGGSRLFRGCVDVGARGQWAGTAADSTNTVHPILMASPRGVEPGSCCKNGGRYRPRVKIDDTIMTDG